MGQLIEDMLALASADSGGWQMHKRPVEPDMLLLECYETFAPQARERGLGLRLLLPEESPKITADPDRISQALSILMDNALSYTPSPGTVTLGSCASLWRIPAPACRTGRRSRYSSGSTAARRPARTETISALA